MTLLAQAIAVLPGQCFRLVDGDASGSVERCPRPVRVRGRLITGKDQRYTVEACVEHGVSLLDWHPIPTPHS